MKPFRFAVCASVVAIVAVLVRGDDWRTVAISAVFGLLVAAMLETMPLIDWLYPKDDK
ncbi:unnamed protein product [Gemmataceae bacterium]|nr:unnamed protein product [Gemmataceae bacterium]VTU02435.1 unnamed protein product [Gemmataceae bacterium]